MGLWSPSSLVQSSKFKVQQAVEKFSRSPSTGSGRTDGFDIIDDFPFMLRLSKHSEPFSACQCSKPAGLHKFLNGYSVTLKFELFRQASPLELFFSKYE